MRRPLREITVMPDVRETRKIGVLVFFPARVVPETYGHGWKRARAYELAFTAADRLAVVVVHVDGHAKSWPLDLAAPDGFRGNAEHEAAGDVGSARDRGEMQVGLDVLINVIKAVRRQRRASRE